MQPSEYPVAFSVDYPARPLSRLRTGFRIILIIPMYVITVLLAGEVGTWADDGSWAYWLGTLASASGAGIGLLTVPTALMIFFRQKYPRWWFDWNLEIMRLNNRVAIFAALMDDHFPSTDERQAVQLDMPYPDAKEELKRGMPLIKWLLAFPHYIALLFVGFAALLAIIAAWFVILFTSRYPRSLFGFVEGTQRWFNRVVAYAFALVTDKYPPFRLSP